MDRIIGRFQGHCQDRSHVLTVQAFEILLSCLISLFNIHSMLFWISSRKKEKPFIERHIYVHVNVFFVVTVIDQSLII